MNDRQALADTLVLQQFIEDNSKLYTRKHHQAILKYVSVLKLYTMKFKWQNLFKSSEKYFCKQQSNINIELKKRTSSPAWIRSNQQSLSSVSTAW